MKLYEFEGKSLLAKEGFEIPKGTLVESVAEVEKALEKLDGYEKFLVKGQTLSGKRFKAGVVQIAESKENAKALAKEMLEKTYNGEKIRKVLIEEKLAVENEYYFSVTFDTVTRAPNLIISRNGGTNVEEIRNHDPEKIVVRKIDTLNGLQQWQARESLSKLGFEGLTLIKLSQIAVMLWNFFKKNDCKVAEINPLIHTVDEDFIVADAKIELDDDALFRHPEFDFPKRTGGKELTEREILARQIDENDYRGTCGSTYLDLDGDIGVIAAGGGASLTCMDSLIACGGKPANYTEHSGNPPAEKVEKLTKIVLSKPGLNGLWFVGGTANFTDIYETLRGFLNGLRSIKPKPDFPIVIRRDGPRAEEAFEMLEKAKKEEGFDFHLFKGNTSMTSTAKIIVELVEDYKKRKGKKVKAVENSLKEG